MCIHTKTHTQLCVSRNTCGLENNELVEEMIFFFSDKGEDKAIENTGVILYHSLHIFNELTSNNNTLGSDPDLSFG